MKLRKFLGIQLLLLGVLPFTAAAAEVSVDSTTILRAGVNTDNRSSLVMPGTQYLGVDLDKLGDGNLSAHIYGWGRYDLNNLSFNNHRADGNLTYGYLQYRIPTANTDFRLGRMFISGGVANEQIDGLSIRSDLPLGFDISAFGGATVHNMHLGGSNRDGKGNYSAGGRLGYSVGGIFNIGISGVYETNAPNLTNYPNPNHDLYNHRLMGWDVWFQPVKYLEMVGHSTYNPDADQFAEHLYRANVRPFGDNKLVIAGQYSWQKDWANIGNWIGFASPGSAYIGANDHKTQIITAEATYVINDNVTISADYKHFQRDSVGRTAISQSGYANRYGADLTLNYFDNTFKNGISYHYLDANSAAFAPIGSNKASYHEIRVYTMRDTSTYFASLDLIGYFFKIDSWTYQDNSVEAIGSLGYHLNKNWALSGDISVGSDSTYKNEVRGLVKLTFNMNTADKGVKK